MSLWSAGEAAETPNPTNVGGQAVIEGVMMRAPGSLSIVVRRRDGSLVVRERTVVSPAAGLVKLPLVRGMYTLVSSLKMGHQALRWSADLFEEDAEAEEAEKDAAKAKAKAKKGTGALSVLSLWLAQIASMSGDEEPGKVVDKSDDKKKGNPILSLLPIVLAIGLFVALPQAAAAGVKRLFGLEMDVQSPLYQVITGVAKLTIIVGYMSLLRLNDLTRRVFQYHGAEHKSISTYELGRPLLLNEARPTTALHARCGTTFIIMVAAVSVVVFTIVGQLLPKLPGSEGVQWIVYFVLKLPLLPFIAGLTYELQRFFAKYCTTGPLRVLLWPGFLVQKITTAEPDDDQLEVALASLRSALA
ncbi:MAG: DUF1385 domain-containing protein, partial [Polyangiaceae bacterium]|nr:DUF1385 domain-containing protein [Polyangiaceae bacterium]